MPRVRANAAHATPVQSPFKSPVKYAQQLSRAEEKNKNMVKSDVADRIPLNDDRPEKAKRLQSRQALQELQMNQIKAAASPVRKRKSLGGTNREAPDTPSNQAEDGNDLPCVGGNAVTPMKRVPILANFEEWMKMATDNKINATNSWNFALIDYFHDMSFLKEGDGVNFQKASCTLDGCVKIYTSRVDSVATETGKLLSGLADSGNKRQKGDRDDGEGGDGEDEEGEDGVKKRAKKKTQRSSEATLATSFAQLQLKKMELEFSVDPLFKKASADFDEGGAKGLLLNHLAIDGYGRIVFDSSDDVQEASADEIRRDSLLQGDKPTEEEEKPQSSDDRTDFDISGLAARFFPDLSILDDQDICPSLKAFELGDGTGSLDLPFLKAPDDWRKDREEDNDDIDDARSGIVLDDNEIGFDDDDDALGGFDLPPETGFGEGGEAWAKEAAIQPQMRVHRVDQDGEGDLPGGEGEVEVGGFDSKSKQYGITLNVRGEDDHENILNYFDQALQKNWAGLEHWKIKRIKDNSKAATAPTAKRKEKEPFEIDFAGPMTQSLADMLYTPAASNAAISLPRTQWKSKTRNLLPDDKHFNSRNLLRLFLKPKARLGSRHKGQSSQTKQLQLVPEGEIDEAYWAQNQDPLAASPKVNNALQGDYDANFFQDDGLHIPGGGIDDDEEDFADARETLSPPLDGAAMELVARIDGVVSASQEAAFGTQLVTQSRRLRPEYVQYARVAKKVDVRRLKEEMWRGIGFDKVTSPQISFQAPLLSVPMAEDGSLKFTAVINSLQHVYPKQQMADISTSYCFICLLHLANEKGLVIENQEGFEELSIRRDLSAEIADGAD
ncbi:hypothetical protein LTR66_000301 [Elasticomyces elasticus]|nr:hypothetical protein LTR66_000301 [Elasticomyces elasticus]